MAWMRNAKLSADPDVCIDMFWLLELRAISGTIPGSGALGRVALRESLSAWTEEIERRRSHYVPGGTGRRSRRPRRCGARSRRHRLGRHESSGEVRHVASVAPSKAKMEAVCRLWAVGQACGELRPWAWRDRDPRCDVCG